MARAASNHHKALPAYCASSADVLEIYAIQLAGFELLTKLMPDLGP